ncbi:hypothetical protein CEUSTIGMA_g5971.t1 [Chlamydomonas eustigma]|uniref:MYND-type domain-containing protein n=1 Tax=Chlamydomonas eustigma TaxID=1157962 RepID=A0A250X628_9CHLO|nr:hypothetical protein CEUSTIGMA_g5971.t1 [Chlamydomonas eustigma]|eukprot:GAX78531.1 hypothetical protein CEUSTIGMA_g5971.t1 [Chlamydomonas eustigma]
MSNGAVSLQNFLYFPVFSMLPQADELDANYYSENCQGILMPSRTWCFVAEIVSDALSQEAVLGHRVEVRDLSGNIHSILFYPEPSTVGFFQFDELQTGCTIFIRYAQRCFFSDLATEAIKVEDMNFVKIIGCNLDTLMYVSQACLDQGATCQACHSGLGTLGGSVTKCEACQAAVYCSPSCRQAHVGVHKSYCYLLQELGTVFNVDLDRFVHYVPFRN